MALVVPHRVLRSSDILLRSGKTLSSPAELPSRKRQAPEDCRSFLDLPPELTEKVLPYLQDARDLCVLSQVCSKLTDLADSSPTWKSLFNQKWGPVTTLMEEACLLAGGWKALYKSKTLTDKQASPWQKISPPEMEAAVARIAAQTMPEGIDRLSIVFLIDGSGSVTEEDFRTMLSFVKKTYGGLIAMNAKCKVSVLQFSNDVRVELLPSTVDTETFRHVMADLTRMNGGTNIAVAIKRSGQLLKEEGSSAARVLVLLTDGRVDPYQGREAYEMAARLADEQENVSLWAFGVGRGVERTELERIIGACAPSAAASSSRYVPLCTRDEAPW